MKISKKGQGLAFVSLLVLFAILFFIFRFNTETYGFIMQAGDEQAHLITAYTESAKVKTYVQNAAEQAAMETVWSLSNSKDSSLALSKCNDSNFDAEFKTWFDRYLSMYASAIDLIDTTIPDYKFSFSCPAGRDYLYMEGWGYKEDCIVRKGFSFPEKPCADETDKYKCENEIKFNNDKSKNACKWDSALNCTDALTIDCTADDANTCNNIKDSESNKNCEWIISYSESINVLSNSLTNYQFSIGADAHFIENITSKDYDAFTNTREKAFPPSCNVNIEPPAPLNNTSFNISVIYFDDAKPNSINVKVKHGSTDDFQVNLTSGLKEADNKDLTFDNGKEYYYTTSLPSNKYDAETTCTDMAGNSITVSKSFTVVTS